MNLKKPQLPIEPLKPTDPEGSITRLVSKRDAILIKGVRILPMSIAATHQPHQMILMLAGHLREPRPGLNKRLFDGFRKHLTVFYFHMHLYIRRIKTGLPYEAFRATIS
jgi:hypothetical protein